MKQFDALPAIPMSYPRLTILKPDEINKAREAGYVAETSDPKTPVHRQGLDNYDEMYIDESPTSWRARMYAICFCYIYENILVIYKPSYAMEELILEFKAPSIIDLPHRRLATLYAGAGGAEPTSPSERLKDLESLKPHYEKAVAFLGKGPAEQTSGKPM